MTTKERHLLLLAENQRLETPRLLLRPVSLADAADMFAYANDGRFKKQNCVLPSILLLHP